MFILFIFLVAGKPCGDPNCHVYSSCETSTNTCICPSNVYAVIDEICGSDGKTYQNEAKMQYKACKQNESITKKYKGKCKGMNFRWSVGSISTWESEPHFSHFCFTY